MTLELSNSVSEGSDTAAARHTARAAASAVARAVAWSLSPTVEDLRRTGLHAEADALTTRARDLAEFGHSLLA